MRSLSPIIVAAALFAAPPAFAAAITQTLPAVQTIGDLRPFDIVGSRFDPSLGTLVSVGGQLTGTATPSHSRRSSCLAEPHSESAKTMGAGRIPARITAGA